MRKTHPKPKTASREVPPDEWAASVNTHFQQTGTFRAVDILRVLGNPLEGVVVRVSEHRSFSGKEEPR